MVATAPMATAASRLAAVDATAMTRPPRAVDTSVAARPMPPPAPSTSTHSPGASEVRRVRVNSMVQ